MRYVSKTIAALFCLLLAASPAGSGSMTLLGVGSPTAALSPVAFTFQNSSIGSVANPVQTMGSFSLGAAASATRRVVVMFASSQVTSGATFTAIFTPDVGGTVTADAKGLFGTDVGSGQGLSFASAVLPLGANSTLAVSWSVGINDSPRYAVYTVDNSTLASPTSPIAGFNSSAGAVTSISATANTSAGGGVLAIGANTNPSGTWSSSPTGVATPQDANFGLYGWTHANNVAASTPYTVTQTFASTPNDVIAMLAYR